MVTNFKDLLADKESGFTLVEIVVTLALIGLLGLTFFTILTDNFTQTQTNRKDTKQLREDLTEIHQGYRDTDKGVEEKVTFFDKEVTLRKIKGSNRDVEIIISDHEIRKEPFIDKNGNLLYEEGEEELTASDLLNTSFTYVDSGVLVIPSNKIFEGQTISKIDWDVKEGIYMKASLTLASSTFIRMETTEDIQINSTILTPIQLQAEEDIQLKADGMLDVMQSYIDTNSALILDGTNIYLKGTDRLLTTLKYKDRLEINGTKASDVTDVSEIDGVDRNSGTIIEVK